MTRTVGARTWDGSMAGAILLTVVGVALLAGVCGATRRLAREYVLASFTTDLAMRTPAGRANVERAASHLDGRVVLPHAVFSFNQVVGPRTLEEGYARAPALEMGGVVDTPGGGICQLSSTVYNAALMAGMRIVERWPHAEHVHSVGPGRDATVLYGKWDLRWSNPYTFTVRLRTEVCASRLAVSIVGARPLPEPVAVEVERVRGGSPREAPGEAPRDLHVRVWRHLGARTELVGEDRYLR